MSSVDCDRSTVTLDKSPVSSRDKIVEIRKYLHNFVDEDICDPLPVIKYLVEGRVTMGQYRAKVTGRPVNAFYIKGQDVKVKDDIRGWVTGDVLLVWGDGAVTVDAFESFDRDFEVIKIDKIGEECERHEQDPRLAKIKDVGDDELEVLFELVVKQLGDYKIKDLAVIFKSMLDLSKSLRRE